MDGNNLTALIVDDDSISRMAISFALEQEGFECVLADNGDEALRQLARKEFDLVVTDLRMPIKHGYSLAIEILSQEVRPMVVIHSGIDDLRMTRELIRCGVDDIIYKPSNYPVCAAKLQAMVLRRRRMQARLNGTDTDANGSQIGSQHPSAAVIDIFFMATSDDTDSIKLLRMVEQDPELAAAVLELARNASADRANLRDTPIPELKQAIRLIGFRKLSELSLERLAQKAASSTADVADPALA